MKPGEVYEYKGEQYKFLKYTGLKCPETGEWLDGVNYEGITKPGDYTCVESRFTEKFKKVENPEPELVFGTLLNFNAPTEKIGIGGSEFRIRLKFPKQVSRKDFTRGNLFTPYSDYKQRPGSPYLRVQHVEEVGGLSGFTTLEFTFRLFTADPSAFLNNEFIYEQAPFYMVKEL